ncbi:uncharacterized protein LOC130737111 [Lotus japonicus]|uniref:uncharacterized protein LOC130737111 n=1 Tax=Lotus japonicus TaxID=34305 RepID=UPI002588ABFB|nr:uncharacterized protein LOC130737111 [Lotus japonicus]
MAAVGSGIVLEPLTKGNYDNWSRLVENYLRGQVLWDVVDPDLYEIWRMKNAKVLHIIQLACGSEALTHIRKGYTAKDAWNELHAIYHTRLKTDLPIEQGPAENDVFPQNEQLHQYVLNGDWEHAKSFIDSDPEAIFTTSCSGRTILHFAVIAGHEKIVDELVNIGKDRLLNIQDKNGYTALAFAAELTGNTNMAKCILSGGKGQQLLTRKIK